MSRVTSKLQVTIPKVIAERHGIRPGDELSWQSIGEAIRIVTEPPPEVPDIDDRLELFDRATDRQQHRDRTRRPPSSSGRGWTREELYTRGRPD